MSMPAGVLHLITCKLNFMKMYLRNYLYMKRKLFFIMDYVQSFKISSRIPV